MAVEHLRRVLVAAVCFGATAHASPWYEGKRGKQRLLHGGVTLGFGAAFVTSELAKGSLAADPCRWCSVPRFDAGVRDALVWDDVDRARTLSNLTGYLAAPAIGLGLTAAGVLAADDASWARLIDDTLPIFETLAIGGFVTQVVKLSVGRQRPFVHYTHPLPDDDDNLSFWSGHAGLAFAVLTSAGVVASDRGSALAPVIWGAGIPIATATAYFRVAGDKHYATDVVIGSAAGVVSGLLVPRLLRQRTVTLAPAPGGVSLVGSF